MMTMFKFLCFVSNITQPFRLFKKTRRKKFAHLRFSVSIFSLGSHFFRRFLRGNSSTSPREFPHDAPSGTTLFPGFWERGLVNRLVVGVRTGDPRRGRRGEGEVWVGVCRRGPQTPALFKTKIAV